MPEATHLATGRWAERQAERYLVDRGLTLVGRNFRCRAGEIDLVMTDAHVLVFVEVRFRRGNRFGSGLDSVTPAKQRRLLNAARAYLASHGAENATCRFDVLSVSKRNYRPDFFWVQNAFGQDA